MVPDAGIVTNLGVSGFALWILWMQGKSYLQRMREKDAEHATQIEKILSDHDSERREFRLSIDKRDESFRRLEADMRSNLATVLIDSGNILKQAVLYTSRPKKKR